MGTVHGQVEIIWILFQVTAKIIRIILSNLLLIQKCMFFLRRFIRTATVTHDSHFDIEK